MAPPLPWQVNTSFGSSFPIRVCDIEMAETQALSTYHLMQRLRAEYPSKSFHFVLGTPSRVARRRHETCTHRPMRVREVLCPLRSCGSRTLHSQARLTRPGAGRHAHVCMPASLDQVQAYARARTHAGMHRYARPSCSTRCRSALPAQDVAYTHTHTHTHTYTYAHIHIHTHIHTCIHRCRSALPAEDMGCAGHT